MAGRGKTSVVDGFTAIRAARRANVHAASEGDETMVRSLERTAQRGEKPGSRIGRTAMPTQKLIVCRLCQHEFPMVGAPTNLMCPGCKEWLLVHDHVVNQPGWNEQVETSGSFIVQADGEVAGGEVVANDIVIRGQISGGKLRAMHALEIHKGAEFHLATIEARDLVIHRGAEFAVDEGVLDRFHNLDVRGALHAHVVTRGTFTLHEGAWFSGRLEAASLQVGEGAVLQATVKLVPEPEEAPAEAEAEPEPPAEPGT